MQQHWQFVHLGIRPEEIKPVVIGLKSGVHRQQLDTA
jgi:hypothetical protein